jgi:hypothetical protein
VAQTNFALNDLWECDYFIAFEKVGAGHWRARRMRKYAEQGPEDDQLRKAMLLVAGLALLVAGDANAQMQWPDQWFVNINGSSQAGGLQSQEVITEPLYGETATYSVVHDLDGGAIFDVSGGVRVWRNLAAGFGMTVLTQKLQNSGIKVSGVVPSPLFFNRPRTVAYQVSGLDHRQVAFHFQALWFVPVTDKIDVALFGGPSVFKLTQDLISSVEIMEMGHIGAGSARIWRASKQPTTRNALGGNVGVDVTYLVTETLGGGFFVRWTGGSVDLSTNGSSQSVDIGGLQIGGGVRVRF